MGKVNPQDFGKGRPKIEPDDLDGTSAVLEVDGYGEEMFDDPESPGGQRKAGYLTFVEFPKQEDGSDRRVLWLNVTALRAIIHHYGDDSDDWIGQLVPVEEIRGTFKKTAYHKVVVVNPPEKWDDFFEPSAPKPRRRATKKRATKKKNGRRTRGK